jgi:hypothetical protein
MARMKTRITPKTSKKTQTGRKKRPTRKDAQPRVLLPGIDYDLNLPKPHLSFSQMDTYQKCPLQYHNRYVLGIKGPQSAAPAEGSAFDNVLDGSNTHYLEHGKHFDLDYALEVGPGSIREAFKEVEEPWSFDEVQERQEVFLKMLWGNKGPNFRPVRLDGRYGTQWQETVTIAGVPVMVIVDMIEKNRVTDFKVAKTARFYSRPERSLQLMLYAHATQCSKVGFMIFEKEKMRITEKEATIDLDFVRWWLETVTDGRRFRSR